VHDTFHFIFQLIYFLLIRSFQIIFSTTLAFYDVAVGVEQIIVPDDGNPFCLDAFYAQFAKLYLRRTNPNMIALESTFANYFIQTQQ
jgi:hypothetical protein